MGKIGVISDVHGNLQALEAILGLFAKENCNEIIHTGDAVDIGPNSRECLEKLLSLPNVTMLLGNHDRDFLLNEFEARKFSHVPTEHKRQVFATMTDELRAAVSRFPLYVFRRCGSSKIMFTHYAFKNEPFNIRKFPFLPLVNPSVESFDEMFEGVECDAVFFGHKHEPCDVQGKKLYVDVGSVGCYPEPFARGIIIEYDETSWKYTRVTAPYEMEKTRKLMTDETSYGKQLYDFYFLLKK